MKNLILFFISSCFSFLHKHNSKTIQHVWAICTTNDCCNIRDSPSLATAACELILVSYTSKRTLQPVSNTSFCVYLHAQLEKTKGHKRTFYYRTIGLLLEISILCVRAVCEIGSMSYGSECPWQPLSKMTFCAYLHPLTQKLLVVYGCSRHRMNPLLFKMSIFCVRAVCKMWMLSYGSKHLLHSIFNKALVRTLMHTLKTSDQNWTFSISNDYYTIGDILCVV